MTRKNALRGRGLARSPLSCSIRVSDFDILPGFPLPQPLPTTLPAEFARKSMSAGGNVAGRGARGASEVTGPRLGVAKQSEPAAYYRLRFSVLFGGWLLECDAGAEPRPL